MKRQTDPYGKDQSAVSYFPTSLIVLIQVYSWERTEISLVCCWGLADILYFLGPIKWGISSLSLILSCTMTLVLKLFTSGNSPGERGGGGGGVRESTGWKCVVFALSPLTKQLRVSCNYSFNNDSVSLLIDPN